MNRRRILSTSNRQRNSSTSTSTRRCAACGPSRAVARARRTSLRDNGEAACNPLSSSKTSGRSCFGRIGSPSSPRSSGSHARRTIARTSSNVTLPRVHLRNSTGKLDTVQLRAVLQVKLFAGLTSIFNTQHAPCPHLVKRHLAERQLRQLAITRNDSCDHSNETSAVTFNMCEKTTDQRRKARQQEGKP